GSAARQRANSARCSAVTVPEVMRMSQVAAASSIADTGVCRSKSSIWSTVPVGGVPSFLRVLMCVEQPGLAKTGNASRERASSTAPQLCLAMEYRLYQIFLDQTH